MSELGGEFRSSQLPGVHSGSKARELSLGSFPEADSASKVNGGTLTVSGMTLPLLMPIQRDVLPPVVLEGCNFLFE